MEEDILDRLKKTAVLQTQAGSYAKPTSLMFMDWAHDRNGDPIFGTQDDYISLSYPPLVRKALDLLGVTGPDSDWIVHKLRGLHRDHCLHTGNRTMEWYSDLAKVLLKVGQAQPGTEYVNALRSIPLIPVEGSGWKTASTASDPIYFPESLGVNIPPGLALTRVPQAACECAHRKKLFRLLGVLDCDVKSIVERIIKHHIKFDSAGSSDIIEQVKYLYHAREYLKPGDMEKIWFAPENDHPLCLGKRVYPPVLASDQLRDLFSGYENVVFLHPGYLQGLDPPQGSHLIEWLEDSASVSKIPRLRSKSGQIHSDFLWLLENKRERILGVLRTNWSNYKPMMTDKIKQKLAQHPFPCVSGECAPLQNTFLPLPQLMQKCQEVCGTPSCSFLALPDDQPDNWTILSQFGVGTKEDLDFYLWILRQPQFKTGTSVERAKKLYYGVQSMAKTSSRQEKVR